MKKDDLEDEDSGGSRMLALLLVMAAIIAVLYLVFGRQTDNNSEHISTVQKYTQICQPFHFVKAEKAAEGLIKIYCLDKSGEKSGEKKEVLIDE